jgi:hypothetical protein
MANCINYNCDSLGSHDTVACNDYPTGGVPAIILLSCDSELTDPSEASQITAEITAGRATLIEGVKASLSEATATEQPSPVSCGVPRVTRYEREISLYDANVTPNNVDFYNSLGGGQSFGGIIMYNCGSDKVFWIDESIQFQGGVVIPDEDDDYIRFEMTGKYRASKTNGSPMVYPAPTGIF